MEDLAKFHSGEFEMFMVRGELVAAQPFYSIFRKQEYRHEIKHFYCRRCGSVWGTRIVPQAVHPPHHYYSSTCRACGGEEDILVPYEWDHIELLGPEVLAYLFLEFTNVLEDTENAKEHSSI